MLDTEGREVLTEKWLGNIGAWIYNSRNDLYPYLRIRHNGRLFILRLVVGNRSTPWAAHMLECLDGTETIDGNYFLTHLDLGIKYYHYGDINKCQKIAFKVATNLIRKKLI